METITSGDLILQYFKELQNSSPETFAINSNIKKSRTIDFFNDLYAYPPKFRIKWDRIDELHNDSFISYNYRTVNSKLPFIKVTSNFLSNNKEEPVEQNTYKLQSYVEGYKNKLATTRIYNKESQQLQIALQEVPVYVITNGMGEIVLANSTNNTNFNPLSITQATYNLCGAFDPLTEQSNKLGLFFMSKHDAELFLDEIITLDPNGTKVLGLSTHCVGLDFAYRVMRSYNPSIDFRIVPDLKEVKNLINLRNLENYHFIFENEQQQLRLRYRSVNPIPIFKSIIKWGGPISSFLENGEYFKGVPIYVVRVRDTPTNFLVHSYYTGINMIDTMYGAIRRGFIMGIGFGKNWILQGSFAKSYPTENATTYVFFEKKAAAAFCQKHGRRILRYPGTYFKILQPLTKKPKIFVYNLEDFLELWEESKIEGLSQTRLVSTKQANNKDLIKIVPAKSTQADLESYSEQKQKSLTPQKLIQFFQFKYRRFNNFMELVLNSN